ncbi:hypothetical protein C0992_005814 [Termitomyces sp. T32_za158]|nr:hypothetical protein C0992_005814 [Termitomyces sp. T32_za158]
MHASSKGANRPSTSTAHHTKLQQRRRPPSKDKNIYRRPMTAQALHKLTMPNPDPGDLAQKIDDLLVPHYVKRPEGDGYVKHADGDDYVRVYPLPLVVTYDGTSQFRFGNKGSGAACGLCASNFIRHVFTKYMSRLYDADLLKSLLTRQSFLVSVPFPSPLSCPQHAQQITDIARHYQRSNYLEGSEIVGAPRRDLSLDGKVIETIEANAGLPYFNWSFIARTPFESRPPTIASYHSILQNLVNVSKHITAAVITRSPEIVAVLKLPVPKVPGGCLYIVFDSHQGHWHPNGAAMVVCSTSMDAAEYLEVRLQRVVMDEDLRFQLGVSFVVARTPPTSAKRDELLLDASMRILHLEIDAANGPRPNPPAAPTCAQQYNVSGAGAGADAEDRHMEQAMYNSLCIEDERKERFIADLQLQLANERDAMDALRKEKETFEAKWRASIQEQEQQPGAVKRPGHTGGNAGSGGAAPTPAPAHPANNTRRSNVWNARRPLTAVR